jgi:membrane-bound lytic murein transglycosylase D
VQRAVARNQARGLPASYEKLRMPAETRNYLPKLQAVKNIIADPARFGLTLVSIPNEPYFATVTTRQHIDVELAARLAGISVEEFRFLNPAHNKPVINANSTEVIVLPRHAVEQFNANLGNHDRPLVSWQAYTVKPGDQPEKIAAKYGISVQELMRVNGISARNRFRAGLSLVVPVKPGATPHLPNLPAPKVARARPKKPRNAAPAKKSSDTAQKTAQGQPSGKKPVPSPRPADSTPDVSGKIKVADAQASTGE